MASVFETAGELSGGAEFALADTMGTFWSNFASSGDPNVRLGAGGQALAPGLHWPLYDNVSDLSLSLDVNDGSGGGVGPLRGVQHAQCDFWDTQATQGPDSSGAR